MRATWLRPLALAVLALALATPAHAQSFGFPWWRDAQFQRDLSLTTDQVTKIDTIFDAAITQLRHKKGELDQQEDELSRMIAANADEALVTRQVEKVEGIRAFMNKTRTLMLLHERQVLTPDQRVKLNRLHEQYVKDHKTSRGDGNVKK